MENWHDPATIHFRPFSAQARDPSLFQHGLTCHISGQQNNARIDQSDDLKDEWTVIIDFLIGWFSKGFSIRPRRHSKDRVCDVDIFFGSKFAAWRTLSSIWPARPTNGFPLIFSSGPGASP